MLNRKIKKIGISMLTLAALTMGGQMVFAASQENPNTATAATAVSNEEAIKYIKELITKDTKILDKASGKMVNASDVDLTKPEILEAVIEALVKEGKIEKAVASTTEGAKEENNVAKTMSAEDEIKFIKGLITKDTKILDKASGKMVNASDADLTNQETLEVVIEALVKEGKIANGTAATAESK